MSVHQESIEMANSSTVEPREAPELAYNEARTDSLSMFAAAIGGAVLGMLLTLLILAIINGGTLHFTGGERLAVFEANLARINENVGSVSTNIDIVAEQARQMQAQLDTMEGTLSDELTGVEESITTLNQTADQFNIFVGALSEALTSMETVVEEGQ